MNTTVQTRTERQRVEDLIRLADQGERNGVRILCEPVSDQHFATSATSPILYRVSADGCGCRGFQAWRRCQHHALYLAEMGLLPDLEQDVVVDDYPADRCRCRGQGYVRATTGPALADWLPIPCACQASAA